IEIRVSSTDFGQGTNVALAQVVADAVGVPLAQVEVVPPDTAAVPDSGPTVASRTVMIIGGVLARAGRTLRQRVADFAEEQVELAGAGFARVADAYLAANGALEVEERFAPDSSESFDEETYRGTAYPAYGWGADVVELEVDPDTLAVKPEKIAMVCDVGKAIHPVLCQGQVEGGSLQALGMAYLEELRMADGKPLGDRLATYIIPTTLDTPAMETVLLENPSGIGPGGAKGVGELPADGAAPALVQAIENATGIVPRGIPATPERLLDDLCAGRTVAGAPEELALELS
ncbi:MAG: xanthine dehydrogenase family protein molybdopterin-binding subunit, partial [Gaiellales bacterium]